MTALGVRNWIGWFVQIIECERMPYEAFFFCGHEGARVVLHKPERPLGFFGLGLHVRQMYGWNRELMAPETVWPFVACK